MFCFGGWHRYAPSRRGRTFEQCVRCTRLQHRRFRLLSHRFADFFCVPKEQKEGGIVPTVNNFVDIRVWILFSFCAYSAPVCLYIFTQSVALGYIPVGASPRHCSNVTSQIICSFAPSLLVTSAAQYLGRCSYWGFAPSLLVTSAAQYLGLCSCCSFARLCSP